jgi:hypothetical protein
MGSADRIYFLIPALNVEFPRYPPCNVIERTDVVGLIIVDYRMITI